MQLVNGLKELAAKKGCSAGQLCLAWELAQGDDVSTLLLLLFVFDDSTNFQIIPIPGTRNVARLEENAAAANIKLTLEEIQQVRSLVESAEVEGDRYIFDKRIANLSLFRYPPGLMEQIFIDTPPRKTAQYLEEQLGEVF